MPELPPGTQQMVTTYLVQGAPGGAVVPQPPAGPTAPPLPGTSCPAPLGGFQRLPAALHRNSSLSPNTKLYVTFCFAASKTLQRPFQPRVTEGRTLAARLAMPKTASMISISHTSSTSWVDMSHFNKRTALASFGSRSRIGDKPQSDPFAGKTCNRGLVYRH